jgi:hypothetical protein
VVLAGAHTTVTPVSGPVQCPTLMPGTLVMPGSVTCLPRR